MGQSQRLSTVSSVQTRPQVSSSLKVVVALNDSLMPEGMGITWQTWPELYMTPASPSWCC